MHMHITKMYVYVNTLPYTLLDAKQYTLLLYFNSLTAFELQLRLHLSSVKELKSSQLEAQLQFN